MQSDSDREHTWIDTVRVKENLKLAPGVLDEVEGKVIGGLVEQEKRSPRLLCLRHALEPPGERRPCALLLAALHVVQQTLQ